MKKSGWISFCGWSAFGLVLFAVTAALLAKGQRVPPIPASVAALALLLAVPSAGLWIMGSVVYRFRASGAKMYAQAMIEAQKRTAAPGCGVCHKRPAVTLCTAHRVLLCGTCLGSHNRPECAYADVSVVVQSSGVTPTPRAVTPAPSQSKERVG